MNKRLTFHIKEQLERRRMSIQELARQSGGRFETVRRMVNGDIERIPVGLLASICAVFNCDVGDIITTKKEA